MCLTRVDFSLKYEKGFYIGKGYKNIALKIVKNKVIFSKDWQEATGNWGRGQKKDLNKKLEFDNWNNPYIPGFHIFLDEIAAISYDPYFLCEVSYSDILAYGQNKTSHYYKGELKLHPCIISRCMRIDKVLAVYKNFVSPCDDSCFVKVINNKITQDEYVVS